MSIPFNDTTNKNGLIQLCERNLSFPDGQITNDTVLFKQFTADINLGMDDVLSKIFKVGGTWQYDDSNQTDYPIITTNLFSGQRDYSFTTDQQGNLILDIYKVVITTPGGIGVEIKPIDQQAPRTANINPDSFIDNQNLSGTPNRYDKTANGIFLDPIPNYNLTGGLKVFINRESTYFTTADTTKKPGFAGLFHEYLSLHASYRYARANAFPDVQRLQNDMLMMGNEIMTYYGNRERDVPRRLRPNIEETR